MAFLCQINCVRCGGSLSGGERIPKEPDLTRILASSQLVSASNQQASRQLGKKLCIVIDMLRIEKLGRGSIFEMFTRILFGRQRACV